MAFLKWLFALPFIFGAIAFTVANPDSIDVIWSPMHEKLTLPLYALILGCMAVGFLLGSIGTWLGMGKLRSERRAFKRENKALSKEIKALKSKKSAANDPLVKQIETDQKQIESVSL